MANNIEKQLKEISERLEQGVKEIFYNSCSCFFFAAFCVTTVVDVSPTEGEPIAELEVPELTGSVQFYDTFMQALQNISPVPIRMMNVEGDAKGYYHQTEKYIAIKEDMSNVQTMKTGL